MIAMLLAMLPPLTASAAPVINITNYYVHTDPNDSTVVQDVPAYSDAAVPRVTTNPITLSADIGGISDDQITNIYYEIKNINTGITTPTKTNRPVKNPNNSNQITFENVQLTEGLNKIIIKYGSTSTVDSKPAWVYFTPVSNITNLKVNDVDFLDGGMYPANAPYTNLNITGSSNNAYQVAATVTGATYEASNFSGGIFTFLTNTNRASDLNLSPGDNKITLVAKNPTNYYTTTRTFIYNNGLGFAYNGKINFKDDATYTSDLALVDAPNLSSNTDNNIVFKADLKNSKGGTAAGVPDYSYADITVVGTGASIRYDFATPALPLATGNLNLNGSVLATTPVSLTSTSAITIGTAYDVHHIAAKLPLNTGATAQEIDVTFVSTLGAQHTTRYYFNFTNPALPYLDYTAQYFAPPVVTVPATPGYEVKLSDQGTNQINEFPATLKFHVNSNATRVKLNIPGFPNNGYYNVIGGIASVDLHDIP
ncbi:hypothetical protein AB4Z22_29335, partial [Paenibacillus sp. TAF58]